MKNLLGLIMSSLLLTACFNSEKEPVNTNDRLLPAPEGAVKDFQLNQDSTFLQTGWYHVSDDSTNFKRIVKKSSDAHYINPQPILTNRDIKGFWIEKESLYGSKGLSLEMIFSIEAAEKWKIGTEKAVGKQIGFVVDNQLIQVLKVNSRIESGAGSLFLDNYSRKELEKMILNIRH